jgi:hypothetical protein
VPPGAAGNLCFKATAADSACATAVLRQQHAGTGLAITGTLNGDDRGENVVRPFSYQFTPQLKDTLEISHGTILAQTSPVDAQRRSFFLSVRTENALEVTGFPVHWCL